MGLRCRPCSSPGPVAVCTWQGCTKPALSREQAPQPTSGHPSCSTDLPATPYKPPAQDLLRGSLALLMPTCCPIQGLPHTTVSRPCPENVSQKHQDTRPHASHPCNLCQVRRTARSNRQLLPGAAALVVRGNRHSGRLRSLWPAEGHCAQLGCWGATLVCRGGIGTASAPPGGVSKCRDNWGANFLTDPLFGAHRGHRCGEQASGLSRSTMDGRRYLYRSVERLLPVSRELLRWQK